MTSARPVVTREHPHIQERLHLNLLDDLSHIYSRIRITAPELADKIREHINDITMRGVPPPSVEVPELSFKPLRAYVPKYRFKILNPSVWEFEDEQVAAPPTPTTPLRPWFRATSHNTSSGGRRLLGKHGPAWEDVPPARQSFTGSPTPPIGKPFIRVTFPTTTKDGLLYDRTVELGSKYFPSLRIKHEDGDRDREEFFEPTQEQITHLSAAQEITEVIRLRRAICRRVPPWNALLWGCDCKTNYI
jgi:hypothetical protein